MAKILDPYVCPIPSSLNYSSTVIIMIVLLSFVVIVAINKFSLRISEKLLLTYCLLFLVTLSLLTILFSLK